MQEYKALYRNFIQTLNASTLVFSYLIIDELYTFIGKKRRKYYLWTAICVTQTGRRFYFYHLSKEKSAGALFIFNQDLPKVQKVHCDGHFGYQVVYGDKATMQKSKITNIIENLNSQIRDKVSYLVRRTKAHAKSARWLDRRLAMFFVNKNLEG